VHPELRSLWRDYRTLPAERALAIAGDPERSRFVAGAVGGLETRAGAESEALRECQRRRQRARIQDPCKMYAIGDEVIWSRTRP
jgi:hypothetical protein